ncbi:MAG: hypothetical protein HFI11_01340 [Lachnospiraceae bacterium]|nr:hypothetical protein [Lachnospiraceae bacterium]
MFSEFFVTSSKQTKIAAGIAFGFLCLILLPLFIIAHFNYPCSDDFAYAGAIYTGVKNGIGFREIVKGCWETAVRFYHDWQGRYFDDIISAFGIGTAIPRYYFLGSWLTLVLFAGGCLGFVRTVTYKVCRWDSDISWITAVLMTAMQILYVPYPSEGFYWYVGATGYTMAYALLLLLGQMLIRFYLEKDRSAKKTQIFSGIIAVILTAMIGGSNYSTGLLTAEILMIACILMLMQKKRCGFLMVILAEYLICFVKFNALSPGNNARMGNVESLGVAGSIAASLKQGAVFIKEWLRLPVFLMLVVIFLLGTYQVAKMKFSFRFPGVVTVISFGLYCSMMTPPFFAGATWGPGRLINLVYFSYYFFLTGNLLYWAGWAVRRFERLRPVVRKEVGVLPVLLCFLALLLISLKIYGLQSTSSSSALLSLVKGEATEYLKENESRWDIYTDDSVQNAEVEDFFVKPYVLYHDDITEDETDWRNSTVAGFFGKDSVKLIR